MKKALMISFVWLFSIIVGAMILSFFLWFASKQISTAGKTDAGQIIFSIDDSLNALSTSITTNKEIPLGKEVEINFKCSNVSILDLNKETNKVIFAPEKIRSSKLQAWTQSFELPFRIANLFYLSTDDIKIYLIYDTNNYNQVEEIKKTIPMRFKPVSIDINRLDLDQVKKSIAKQQVHFIFFTTPKQTDKILREFNSKIIQINLDEGKIIFYPDKQESFYLDPLLYGAIFSADYKNYKCLLDVTLKKLSLISKIYSQKAYYLALKNQNCQYTQIINTLKEFSNIKDKILLEEYSTQIKQQNRLLDQNDCPKVY